MVPRDRTMDTKSQEIKSEHKRTVFVYVFFKCECGQTVEQVVQRGCGVSICGDTQKPSRHGPGQLAVADLACAPLKLELGCPALGCN